MKLIRQGSEKKRQVNPQELKPQVNTRHETNPQVKNEQSQPVKAHALAATPGVPPQREKAWTVQSVQPCCVPPQIEYGWRVQSVQPCVPPQIENCWTVQSVQPP